MSATVSILNNDQIVFQVRYVDVADANPAPPDQSHQHDAKVAITSTEEGSISQRRLLSAYFKSDSYALLGC